MNAEQVLSKGLKSGYAGGGKRLEVMRGPFPFVAMEHEFPELDARYSDQWIVKRIGGGQEVAEIGDDMATRVFAGGVVKPEILKELGVSKDQVLSYHKSKLSGLAERARLHENVEPQADGDWQYRYAVLKEFPELPLSVGIETIRYKGTDVFVHVFLNSPIE